MDDNKNGTLLLTVIGVATLLVAVLGATFAFFTANIENVEKERTVELVAGRLDIAYADGSELTTISGIIPQTPTEDGTWDATGAPILTKTFSVTGNNSTASVMPYRIDLVLKSNEFTTGVLDYQLLPDNWTTGMAADSTVQDIPAWSAPQGAEGDDAFHNVTLGSGEFVGPTVEPVVHNYTLYVFFTDSGNTEQMNAERGKTIEAYVNIVALPATPATPA